MKQEELKQLRQQTVVLIVIGEHKIGAKKVRKSRLIKSKVRFRVHL